MADIQISATVTVSKGSFKDTYNPGLLSVTQASAGRGGGTQTIGTSESVISLANVSSLGYCVFQNLDATNYLDWGPESAGAMVIAGPLNPGEFCIVRLKPGATYRAQANSASCRLDVRAYEG
jgi:hypothetical protein